MNYFLLGIKGSGMSALASILYDLDNHVTGSDVEDFFFTENQLNEKDIKVTNFDIKHINQKIHVLILGNAFSDEHPQVLEAKKLKIKVMRYFDFLNDFAKDKRSIAISGTNGKTTTTSLITQMLGEDKINYLIGDGQGSGKLNNDNFVFEACEYKNIFWNYKPDISIITNVEMDHPDFFKNENDVLNSFQKYIDYAKLVIINIDDRLSNKLKHKNIISVSLLDSKADLYINITSKDKAGFTFELFWESNKLGYYTLPFFGDHMIYNSLSAIAVGLILDEKINYIINNLKQFSGAKRRFEILTLNQEKEIYLIDDFAHHPTSIDLIIDAIRQKFPTNQFKLTVIFQPHTFSRTIEFIDEFAQSLSKADHLYLSEIYGSIREKNNKINIEILKEKIILNGYNNLIDDINDLDHIKDNHVICLLGAGNIDTLYKEDLINLFMEGK